VSTTLNLPKLQFKLLYKYIIFQWQQGDLPTTQPTSHLVCLATCIATPGDAFFDFIPSKFGSCAPKWSNAFKWYIDHVFNTVYHKITGNSMLQWTDHINFFGHIAKKVAEVPVSVQQIVNGILMTLTCAVICDSNVSYLWVY
jgi:hypothetical protein